MINLIRDALCQFKKIDVFAFRLAYFQPLGMIIKAIRPSVVTLWFHDGIVEEVYFVHPDFKHRVFWRIFEFLEKLGSRFVDWEFPVSEKMLNYSLTKGIQGRKGSVVLPCVVELNRFYE